jgi:hypothetical protein
VAAGRRLLLVDRRAVRREGQRALAHRRRAPASVRIRDGGGVLAPFHIAGEQLVHQVGRARVLLAVVEGLVAR